MKRDRSDSPSDKGKDEKSKDKKSKDKKNKDEKNKRKYKYETLAQQPSEKPYNINGLLSIDSYSYGKVIEHEKLCHCTGFGNIKWEKYIYETDTWVSGCNCYELTDKMIRDLDTHDQTLKEKIRIIVTRMQQVQPTPDMCRVPLTQPDVITMQQITHICHYYNRYDRAFIKFIICLLDILFKELPNATATLTKEM
jgi:hypothetical protein